MANKRQRKKNAKNYEGTGQYRGGRKEGRKNLIKTPEGFKNQWGVTFTKEEKKKLESAVNSANAKRRKMLQREAELPRKYAGKETGDTVASLQLMGKESDFILAKKTKSLQRFRSKADFERYMANLERVNSKDYLIDRARLYKRNYMKALDNVFGDDAKDIKMRVRMMKPLDFMHMVEQDEVAEINYIYDPQARSAKMNQIRAAFNMKQKEDDFLEYDEYIEY